MLYIRGNVVNLHKCCAPEEECTQEEKCTPEEQCTPEAFFYNPFSKAFEKRLKIRSYPC